MDCFVDQSLWQAVVIFFDKDLGPFVQCSWSQEIAKIWYEENVQSSFHNCRLFDEVKCYRRRLNLKTKNILFARNNMSKTDVAPWSGLVWSGWPTFWLYPRKERGINMTKFLTNTLRAKKRNTFNWNPQDPVGRKPARREVVRIKSRWWQSLSLVTSALSSQSTFLRK